MKPQKKITKRTAVEMRLTLDNLIQHYLNNQQLRGLRPDTIDSARKVLGRMARALGGSTAIKDLSGEAIEGYALSLQTRTTRYNGHPFKNGPVDGGLSPFTVRKEIKTIRAFGNWLAEEGWPNPFDVLIMPKDLSKNNLSVLM
jgi:site-specific recombinase XerD